MASARLDYYMDNGAVLSVDGGAARVENEIFVTGIGRVQVHKAIKPYARAALAHDRYNIFGYWNSRTSMDPQYSLISGLPLEERSDIFHLEGQQNWNFQPDRGRMVYGASYRNTQVNTSGTLMDPANDDRSDDYYSGYGQVEYTLTPQLRIVGAGRVDDGNLFDGQFSPRAPWSSAPTRATRSGSRSTAPSRRRTTPSSSSVCRWQAPSAGPATVEDGIQNYYAGVQAQPLPPAALAGLTITTTCLGTSRPRPRRSPSATADLEVETVTRLGAGLQGKPVREAVCHGGLLHQRPQGLRHRPAAGRKPDVSQASR